MLALICSSRNLCISSFFGSSSRRPTFPLHPAKTFGKSIFPHTKSALLSFVIIMCDILLINHISCHHWKEPSLGTNLTYWLLDISCPCRFPPLSYAVNKKTRRGVWGLHPKVGERFAPPSGEEFIVRDDYYNVSFPKRYQPFYS